MRITSATNELLGQLTDDKNFIAIEELHNSRSAIKFIMDHIDDLAPLGRKTYFLTELFPPDNVY